MRCLKKNPPLALSGGCAIYELVSFTVSPVSSFESKQDPQAKNNNKKTNIVSPPIDFISDDLKFVNQHTANKKPLAKESQGLNNTPSSTRYDDTCN